MLKGGEEERHMCPFFVSFEVSLMGKKWGEANCFKILN